MSLKGVGAVGFCNFNFVFPFSRLLIGNPMWYTFELIPHWLAGSVPVLC